VLLPSVDRVGRYFPLTVVSELPADLPPMAVAIQGRQWFSQVETLALRVLESEDFNLEAFDEELRATAASLARIEQYFGVDLGADFPDRGRYWRVPMLSTDRMAGALIDPLMCALGRSLGPLSLWWTDGSENMDASCLLAQSLPDSQRFVAMLDGRWSDAGWQGELAALVHEPPPVSEYRCNSAAGTDAGPVRERNQDRVLDRNDAGLWVVADGMGGHTHGERASQLIVDVLASTEPAATLEAALERARVDLERANDDLRHSQRSSKAVSGSTVVVLCIRRAAWGVLWAGDSRAYLWRDGQLRALTRDHAVLPENFEEGDTIVGGAPPPSTNEITRAVGGDDVLRLDRVIGEVRDGDRFLLCSDGLHGTLSHEQLREVLATYSTAELAMAALMKHAIDAGSRDNVSAVVVDARVQK
jgi:serine/threonine protein phosphatase PrpC